MKITVTHYNNRNQILVSTMTTDQFFTRISHDDARGSVARLRSSGPLYRTDGTVRCDLKTWKRVYPAAELAKDGNGNLVMKACNGVLVFRFVRPDTTEPVDRAKRSASMLPSTLAAFADADGQSLVVWVRYARPDSTLPDDETQADHLYRRAYDQIMPLYRQLLGLDVAAEQPSVRQSILFTLDPAPFYRPDAVPVQVDTSCMKVGDECKPSMTKEADPDGTTPQENIQKMIGLLTLRYDFRYNTVMKYDEYLSRERPWHGYRPLDPRVQKRMTLEVQLADIQVSIRDVRNFLESDYISSYSPIDEYLFRCEGQWDGTDHIRALARTVPTDNPHWPDWFYTWFLGMVDQWSGSPYRQYGNSVVPLLISRQGYNKSTFCRRLLPPELQWGYHDNLDLNEKRQVFQAMSQFLLINLDEFNRISPQVQQGFLKNIIQLPTLKLKRPYGSHVEEFPRLASFIATSNMDDVLSDPSGNRRFLGVELTGPIDVSVRPNHVQLFAQALAALRAGEKSYFDSDEVKLIMSNNRQFEVIEPAVQYFRLLFEPAKDEYDGCYLTAAEIFDMLRKQYGAAAGVGSLMSFGRRLSNISRLQRRRTNAGVKYLVRKK